MLPAEETTEPTEPSSGKLKVWRLAPFALVPAVVAALAFRLVAHALYLHDHESLMVPTVGRELAHGHWLQAPQLHYNFHQGGVLIDGALSAVGFRLFGDHLLAWKWYSLAYAAGITVAGIVVLRKSAGTAGAIFLALLMAAAPFLVKDAILTPAGHHSTAFFYALAALAIAMQGSERGPPSFRRALFAGLVLGVGVWYTRTCLAAGPAVALALFRGGIRTSVRAWAGLAAGCLIFPAMVAVEANAALHQIPALAHTPFSGQFGRMLTSIAADHASPEYAAKTWEALSLPLEPVLFGQPVVRALERTPIHSEFARAGQLWSWGWAAVPVALAICGAALLAARRGPRRETAVVLLFGLGYAAIYVLSPFRIESSDLLVIANSELSASAPGVAAARYVIPIYLAWTVGAAHVLGLGWRWRWSRPVAVIALGALVGSGLQSAVIDWRLDRDQPSNFDLLLPYDYELMFTPARGLTAQLHLECQTREPVSRANHLRSYGFAASPEPVSLREGQAMAHASESLDGRGLPPEQEAFVFDGMGRGAASHIQPGGPDEAEYLAAVFRFAEELGPPRSGWFLTGFSRVAYGGGFPADRSLQAEELCRTRPGLGRPACHRVGEHAVDPRMAHLPASAPDLFMAMPPIPPGAERELFRGAGRRLARWAPWDADELSVVDGWPEAAREGFMEGWTEERRLRSFRDGDPWEPARVP